jgi:hypothetical protein
MELVVTDGPAHAGEACETVAAIPAIGSMALPDWM